MKSTKTIYIEQKSTYYCPGVRTARLNRVEEAHQMLSDGDSQSYRDVGQFADDEDADDGDDHRRDVLTMTAAAPGRRTTAAGRRRSGHLAVGGAGGAGDALTSTSDVTKRLRQTAIEYSQHEQWADRTKHEMTRCLVDDEVDPVFHEIRLHTPKSIV